MYWDGWMAGWLKGGKFFNLRGFTLDTPQIS